MRTRMAVTVASHLRREVLSLGRLWSKQVATWFPLSGPAVQGPLLDRVCALENLRKALKRVQENGDTPGSDGITPTAFAQQAEQRLSLLQRCLRSGHYRPGPLRPFTMAKKDGGVRRLAVLTVQDRVAQRAVLNVLEELFEHRFSNASFAYRPDRSVQQALRRAVRLHKWGYQWLVDGDITEFFDNVRHSLLQHFLREDIQDEQVVLLIGSWLTAAPVQYRPRSPLHAAEPLGLVQGGVLSPLLSHAYLHRFDQALAQHHIQIVRFADDFLAFTKTKSEAHQAWHVISHELQRLGLTLNPAKSRICHFHEGFTFLGKTFHAATKGIHTCRWCT